MAILLIHPPIDDIIKRNSFYKSKAQVRLTDSLIQFWTEELVELYYHYQSSYDTVKRFFALIQQTLHILDSVLVATEERKTISSTCLMMQTMEMLSLCNNTQYMYMKQ